MFGPHTTVNLSDASCELSRAYANVWVLMVLDACALPEPPGPKALLNFTAAPVGAFKTVTLSACRLGQQAYGSWNFTKSFADFMAQKVEANNGHFQIPVDLFSF